jgi:hypothetical protein
MPHPSVASVSELRGLCGQRVDALLIFGFGITELGPSVDHIRGSAEVSDFGMFGEHRGLPFTRPAALTAPGRCNHGCGPAIHPMAFDHAEHRVRGQALLIVVQLTRQDIHRGGPDELQVLVDT